MICCHEPNDALLSRTVSQTSQMIQTDHCEWLHPLDIRTLSSFEQRQCMALLEGTHAWRFLRSHAAIVLPCAVALLRQHAGLCLWDYERVDDIVDRILTAPTAQSSESPSLRIQWDSTEQRLVLLYGSHDTELLSWDSNRVVVRDTYARSRTGEYEMSIRTPSLLEQEQAGLHSDWPYVIVRCRGSIIVAYRQFVCFIYMIQARTATFYPAYHQSNHVARESQHYVTDTAMNDSVMRTWMEFACPEYADHLEKWKVRMDEYHSIQHASPAPEWYPCAWEASSQRVSLGYCSRGNSNSKWHQMTFQFSPVMEKLVFTYMDQMYFYERYHLLQEQVIVYERTNIPEEFFQAMLGGIAVASVKQSDSASDFTSNFASNQLASLVTILQNNNNSFAQQDSVLKWRRILFFELGESVGSEHIMMQRNTTSNTVRYTTRSRGSDPKLGLDVKIMQDGSFSLVAATHRFMNTKAEPYMWKACFGANGRKDQPCLVRFAVPRDAKIACNKPLQFTHNQDFFCKFRCNKYSQVTIFQLKQLYSCATSGCRNIGVAMKRFDNNDTAGAAAAAAAATTDSNQRTRLFCNACCKMTSTEWVLFDYTSEATEIERCVAPFHDFIYEKDDHGIVSNFLVDTSSCDSPGIYGFFNVQFVFDYVFHELERHG